MIIEYIEDIRKKPKKVRRTYALFITIVITSIIVFIWLLFMFFNSLGTRSAENKHKTSDEIETSEQFKESNTFIEGGDSITNPALKGDWVDDFEDLQRQDDEKNAVIKTGTTTQN